jgi:hypothetical protein
MIVDIAYSMNQIDFSLPQSITINNAEPVLLNIYGGTIYSAKFLEKTRVKLKKVFVGGANAIVGLSCTYDATKVTPDVDNCLIVPWWSDGVSREPIAEFKGSQYNNALPYFLDQNGETDLTDGGYLTPPSFSGPFGFYPDIYWNQQGLTTIVTANYKCSLICRFEVPPDSLYLV